MMDYDTIRTDYNNFYKVSHINIDPFFIDSLTAIILYSTWCSGLDSVPYHIDLLKKNHPNLRIYLITSHLTSSVNENIEYLKTKNLHYDVMFIDPQLYKGINWAVKFNNFIKSLCPSFTETLAGAPNIDQFVIYKKGGAYAYDIYK